MTEHHDHHLHSGLRGAAPPSQRRLALAIALTAVVFVAEVVGGIWTGSLALLSDAAHVFTDLISLVLSFGALAVSARPVTSERTFGWHRAEVLAALVNGMLLFAISGFLLYEAYTRLLSPVHVRATGMLVVAAAGLVANGVIALGLRGHAHHDINVRSAYLHVIADLAGSVGVVLAAAIIIPTNWFIADPILGIAIALAVLFGSGRLLRDSIHILLEGVPRDVDLHEVAKVIRAVPGVDDIHDLHIWTICSNLLALSVHVEVGERSAVVRDEIVRAVNDELRLHYQIIETTIQTEPGPCRTGELIHLVPHQEDLADH
ncbi:MAG: cation diffusion facilitator family transporter [Armatimonadota bacterium]